LLPENPRTARRSQTAAEASQRISRASGVGEVDKKEDVLERASKRIKLAKAEDNGFVDLTVDED
jgi:hypothetical protein